MSYPVAYRNQRAVDQGRQGFRPLPTQRRYIDLRRVQPLRSWDPFRPSASQAALRDAFQPQREVLNRFLGAALGLRSPLGLLSLLYDLLRLWLRQPDPTSPFEAGFDFTGGSMVCGVPDSGGLVGAQNACGDGFVKSIEDWMNELARPRPWYRSRDDSWNIGWYDNVRKHPVDSSYLLIDFKGWWRQLQFPQGNPAGAVTEYIPHFRVEEGAPEGEPNLLPPPWKSLDPGSMRPDEFEAAPGGLPWEFWPLKVPNPASPPSIRREAGYDVWHPPMRYPYRPPLRYPYFDPPPLGVPDVVIEPVPRVVPKPEPGKEPLGAIKPGVSGPAVALRREPNSHRFARAPKGTKEIKVKTSIPYRLVGAAINVITETDDVSKCMYGALPKKLRNAEWLKEARGDRERGVKKTTANFMQRRLRIVARNLHHVEAYDLVQCLVVENLKDMLVGKSRQALAKTKRKYLGHGIGAGISRLGTSDLRVPYELRRNLGG